ncbi:hypothetical protein MIDIC_140018 [Alphaproteobacteria bacterium]
MAEFRINDNTAGDQRCPAAAPGKDAGFIVAWGSSGGTGDVGWDVYARRFDASGGALAPSFRVNDQTSGYQGYFSPKIASFADGSFAVTWWSFGNSMDTGSDVWSRVFDANGSPLALSFKVNDVVGGDQDWSKIVSLKNGDFVVTWGSSDATKDVEGEYICACVSCQWKSAGFFV